jgi:hypothetical protein
MRSAILLAAILPVLLPVSTFAKGPTVKITLEGGSLAAPLAITDPHALAPFRVWDGHDLGTRSRTSTL